MTAGPVINPLIVAAGDALIDPLIVAAGDALIDLISRPDGSLTPVPGGGPYNAARAIGRLGVRCAFLGGLSDDRFGRLLEAGLAGDGVSLELTRRSTLPTTLALAEIGADGSARYRFYVDGTSAPAVPPARGSALPDGTAALLTGTLGLVLEPLATTLEAVVAGLDDSVTLLLDINARPVVTPDAEAWRARVGRLLPRVDVVKASVDDLAFLSPAETPASAARRIAGRGPRMVLVTDGDGPVRVLVGGAVHEVTVAPVSVVDTVGAGDTFGGAVLAFLVHDGATRTDLADPALALRATRFGVRASGITCERAGADPPTIAELGGWPAAGA